MNPKKTIVVDADAIVSQIYPNDSNFLKARTISAKLQKIESRLVYPITAITEAATVLQTKLNSPESALEMTRLIIDSGDQIVEIDKQRLIDSLKYFDSKSSKKNTLFDCIVAAIAEEYKADAIFSFDRFYKTKGFKLADELK